jgi:hypothetical protein
MKPVLALVLLVALSSFTAAPARADAAALVAATRALDEAVSAGRAEPLLKARAQLVALSAADPEAAALHYWVAVASWRAVPILSQQDRKRAELVAKDGLAHCDEALRLDKAFVEAYALKGGLMGMMIMFDPSSMMTLGPQSEAQIQRALGLAPRNPRVRLLQGLGTLNKPAQFGGGADKAREIFKQAQVLYAADTSADSTAPHWGRADAMLWAGQSAMRLGDFPAARDEFVAALAADPNNVWIRGRLLPAVQDSLAKRKDRP